MAVLFTLAKSLLFDLRRGRDFISRFSHEHHLGPAQQKNGVELAHSCLRAPRDYRSDTCIHCNDVTLEIMICCLHLEHKLCYSCSL